ncbi:hypothetical protein VTI74DRAFT_9152 [Chaetomium olivicolor]
MLDDNTRRKKRTRYAHWALGDSRRRDAGRLNGTGSRRCENGCSSIQRPIRNIHLALGRVAGISRPRQTLVVDKNKGCFPARLHCQESEGFERIWASAREYEPLSVAGNWFACPPTFPRGLLIASFISGNRRRSPGTRNGITATTSHTSGAYDSTLPARQDWTEDDSVRSLCSLPRRSGQGCLSI